ncbi:hypothetical protein DLJ47_17075 [Micromonospora sp. S4605]|uniref:hypothetical protein n=1 Tax=Micromonospora sp. S4605 TaxID=1420897 RepID=UPI000D6EDAA4|nr:hypothetical protein [Micromonospora sp. S4605]PWU53099.1 hypothetical protein DLJ47_17075 [Micromonospora sp. S4605]
MVDTQNPPARSRPGVVTISSYLLILFAVLQVISLIISLATIGTVRDVLDEAYSGTSANGMQNVADFAFAAGIASSILFLLLSLGLAVLALFNNRGSNGSRIATWILGGIMVCCTGGNLIGGVTGSFGGTTGGTDGDVPSGEEIQRMLDDRLPAWVTPVTVLLGVLSLLALLAALILLALPKANEFFRKPKQVWEPPVPGASYPGYPQAPGQPGYPQTPGQPGYPAAPGYPPAPGQPGGAAEPPYPGGPQQPGSAPGGPEQPGGQPGSDRPGPTPPPVS